MGRRQQWTLTCPARAANWRNCAVPVGKAFDHHDGKIEVTRSIVLVDTDGKVANKKVSSCVVGKGSCKTNIDYNKRSTYRVLYDACDRSGNCAEQPEVILVLDDVTKPTIVPCIKGRQQVEAACNNWKLCPNTIVTDNIDSTARLLTTLTYTVTHNCNRAFCKGFKDGNLLVNKGTYKKAAKSITTLMTGTFNIKLEAHDFAGKYGGKNWQGVRSNNVRFGNMVVVVKDTLKPKITIVGANPATHECATPYNDKGSKVKDCLDDKIKRKIIVREDSVKITANPRKTYRGEYTVTYNAHDSHLNKAATKKRSVNVVDTTPPVLRRIGSHLIEHVDQSKFINAGSTCRDTCDLKNVKTTTRWVGKKFTDKDVGRYTMEYKCCDKSPKSKCSTVRRTWNVVDKNAPRIELAGKDEITVEASTTAEYTDAGATCTDYVDDDLSADIIISGDLVDYRTPGTYTIKFNCKDKSNNKAVQMNRKVVVVDTTPPTLTRNGPATLEIEAGFPYKDQGAKASDTLDGVIEMCPTDKYIKRDDGKRVKRTCIVTSGDSVNTAKAFYAFRSCAAIKKNDKKAESGMYTITVGAANKLMRKTVYCDMKYKQTLFACDNCRRVIPYRRGTNGDCGKHGMKMATFGIHSKASAKRYYTKNGAEESRYFPSDARATFNFYLCTPKNNNGAVNSLIPKHGDISHAEQGKYIITYSVKDVAGNVQAGVDPKHRTVVVKDTLPPVITLHYQGKMIHKSDASKRGIARKMNPAGKAWGNPFFMAESQTVNGWVIGAVASAVAGVALLAASSKTRSSEVPV